LSSSETHHLSHSLSTVNHYTLILHGMTQETCLKLCQKGNISGLVETIFSNKTTCEIQPTNSFHLPEMPFLC